MPRVEPAPPSGRDVVAHWRHAAPDWSSTPRPDGDPRRPSAAQSVTAPRSHNELHDTPREWQHALLRSVDAMALDGSPSFSDHRSPHRRGSSEDTSSDSRRRCRRPPSSARPADAVRRCRSRLPDALATRSEAYVRRGERSVFFPHQQSRRLRPRFLVGPQVLLDFLVAPPLGVQTSHMRSTLRLASFSISLLARLTPALQSLNVRALTSAVCGQFLLVQVHAFEHHRELARRVPRLSLVPSSTRHNRARFPRFDSPSVHGRLRDPDLAG